MIKPPTVDAKDRMNDTLGAQIAESETRSIAKLVRKCFFFLQYIIYVALFFIYILHTTLDKVSDYVMRERRLRTL